MKNLNYSNPLVTSFMRSGFENHMRTFVEFPRGQQILLFSSFSVSITLLMEIWVIYSHVEKKLKFILVIFSFLFENQIVLDI